MNEHSNVFINALNQGDLEKLRTVPKADLHNHGFLGTRRKHIETWSGSKIVQPPHYFKSLNDMNAYANNNIVPHILSKEGVEFVFTSAINDAIDDGVTVLEMSIDARIIALSPGGVKEMLRYIHDTKDKFSGKINFRPELGISRDYSVDDVKKVIIECIESGLFNSMDLYGNESVQEPEVYQALYRLAKKNGMKLKAHIGEFGAAKSIWDTMDILMLDEIQHGISAVESPELMTFLAKNSIRLNICPTSNIILSRVANIVEHPIAIFYDYGIPVTINTDDLAIFNQGVSEEYLTLFNAALFTAEELDNIRVASLKPQVN